MSGIVHESTSWYWGCLIASLIAFLPIVLFVRRRTDLKLAGQIFYAGLVMTASSLLVWAVITALDANIFTLNSLSGFVLIGFQLVLLALLLVDGLELTEVVWAHRRRDFLPQDKEPAPDAPMVSIHVPCYNEPPHMVMQTLDALAQLDYPNFEVLVIDNNTRTKLPWKPLEAYCATLGPALPLLPLAELAGLQGGCAQFRPARNQPWAATSSA